MKLSVNSQKKLSTMAKNITDPDEKKSLIRSINSKRARSSTYPQHMKKIDTHSALNDKINEQKILNELLNSDEYNELFNNFILEVNDEIDKYIEQYDNVKYNYFIGGSRSWNNFFKDFYDDTILSPYEKSAIHNTTADLYYFINDTTYVRDIKTDIIKPIFEKYKPLIIDAIKSNEIITPDDNIIINVSEHNFLDGKRSLINSERIYFTLHINQSPSKIIKIENEFKQGPDANPLSARLQYQQQQTAAARSTAAATVAATAAAKAAARSAAAATKAAAAATKAAARSTAAATKAAAKSASKAASSVGSKPASSVGSRVQPGRAAKRGGSNLKPLSKVILSLDIFNKNNVIKSDDLINNLSELIEPVKIASNGKILNYLNLYGLFICLKIITTKIYISDKYNEQKIREQLFNNIILVDEYKTKALKDIAEKYKKVFDTPSNNCLYSDKIYTYHLLRLYANTYSEIEQNINNIEIKIIDVLRPYINETILKINNSLRLLNKEYDDKIFGIFVAGGDALRRYKNDISQTKDIDSKIYVQQSNIDDMDFMSKMDNLILIELCNLVCFLIINTEKLFQNIDKTYTTSDNHEIQYELSNKNQDRGQTNFRYRQVYKNKDFPVDLYSLDYRCKIKITLNDDNDTMLEYEYKIAFLDVVVEALDNFKYEQYEQQGIKKQNVVYSNGIPISSLEFLINDLNKTYHNDQSSLARFVNGKISKDEERYKALLSIKAEDKFIYSYKPFKKEKFRSDESIGLNKTQYIYVYNKDEEDVETDEIKLPILFEKDEEDKETIYTRHDLDRLNSFDLIKNDSVLSIFTNLNKLYLKNFQTLYIWNNQKIYNFSVNGLVKRLDKRGGSINPYEFDENNELDYINEIQDKEKYDFNMQDNIQDNIQKKSLTSAQKKKLSDFKKKLLGSKNL